MISLLQKILFESTYFTWIWFEFNMVWFAIWRNHKFQQVNLKVFVKEYWPVNNRYFVGILPNYVDIVTHSLTAALDQLRAVASSTSNDPGPRSRQHQQIGQCLLPIASANFSVDDPAGASVSSGRSAGVGFYWQLQCLRSRCVLR